MKMQLFVAGFIWLAAICHAEEDPSTLSNLKGLTNSRRRDINSGDIDTSKTGIQASDNRNVVRSAQNIEPVQRKRTGKKQSMQKLTGPKGMKTGKKTAKGKPKSPTPQPPSSGCMSPVATAIVDEIPEVITRNPDRCCKFSGPTAVFVTHAKRDDATSSGFEPFWDTVYKQIGETSDEADVCFVMTGYDQNLLGNKTLLDILVDTNLFVSQLSQVPAMMSTDPLDNTDLIQTIRAISNTPTLASIGIFNSGYRNIIIEAIVSGLDRLQFIGYLDDTDYGTKAADITLQLLNGVPAEPLCFNARIGELALIGRRCEAYYTGVTDQTITPMEGVPCSVNSTAHDIYSAIMSVNANAVWTHVDCCAAVGQAVLMVRAKGKFIVSGCMDENTSGGGIDFVTTQPVQLEAYQASSWANFPVLASLNGKDGRGEQYFPSLQSLINTEIYNVIVA